jgi:hypothetical protein
MTLLFFGAPQLAFLGSLLLHLNHVKSTSQCYCDLNPFSLTHSGTIFKNPLGSQKRKWDCKKLSKGLERWLTSLKNSPAVAVDTGFVPNIHMVALINRSFTILWQYIPLCLFVCFKHRVFLYSHGCTETHSVDQAGLKLMEIHHLCSWELRLKKAMHHHHPTWQYILNSFSYLIKTRSN